MATHDIVIIGDYVSVMVKGEMDVSYFKKITDELLEIYVQNKIQKVIIDVSNTGGPYSESDKLEFASYASVTLKQDIKQYAYIYPKELITYVPKVISQGSGFNARGFISLDDALIWLDE